MLTKAYLRKLANNLKIPIFAVDYRLSPKVKFPYLLYDCIAGVYWIFQFIRDVLGVEVEKYVLLGDSAGGNVAIVVAQWMIESNIEFMPSLISSCYGVLSGR